MEEVVVDDGVEDEVVVDDGVEDDVVVVVGGGPVETMRVTPEPGCTEVPAPGSDPMTTPA